MRILASTTSSSDILVTSSLKSGFVATSTSSYLPSASNSSIPLATSASSFNSNSSSTSITPQETIIVSSNHATFSCANTGAIVGSTIGGVVFITRIVFAIWLIGRHRSDHDLLIKAEPRFYVRDPSDHVYGLMEKGGNTPEIGGEMLRAKMESPRMNSEPFEMESPRPIRERFEMGM